MPHSRRSDRYLRFRIAAGRGYRLSLHRRPPARLEPPIWPGGREGRKIPGSCGVQRSRSSPARTDGSARLRGKRSHPLAVGVHPLSHALWAIEPEGTAWVSVDARIMAQVPVLARTRAPRNQPFAFDLGEVQRRSQHAHQDGRCEFYQIVSRIRQRAKRDRPATTHRAPNCTAILSALAKIRRRAGAAPGTLPWASQTTPRGGPVSQAPLSRRTRRR